MSGLADIQAMNDLLRQSGVNYICSFPRLVAAIRAETVDDIEGGERKMF
jgi:hypothetical protein